MTSNKTPDFVITRIFAAPRQRVWDAWTKPELIERWFGPKGSKTEILHHDLRPGGMLHSAGETPAGPMYAKFVYREVEPPSRLVWEHSFADADAKVVRAPFSETWPLVLLTTVLFADKDNDTELTLTWRPLDATPDEIKTFQDAMQGMEAGWSGSFEVLDAFLAKTT